MEINNIKKSFILKLNRVQNLEQLEHLRIEYLGRKGVINNLLAEIKALSVTRRRAQGKIINALKTEISRAIEKKSQDLEQAKGQKTEWVDLTEPGDKPQIGNLHLITQAIEEITRIFEKIGFTRVRYPTVDWDWYVFEALNMDSNHPARDSWETFFIKAPSHAKYGQMVLTPHTSNGQVREMERVGKPPIRMLNIAQCFRRQQDVTHLQSFFQFEGLVIDKNVSIAHLKGTIDYFAYHFYGPKAKSRLRPYHFRFTEPSFEVDFTCSNCNGTQVLANGEKCRFCKSGWHEVGGAGMVHPNVLKNGGIDPEKYSGFAFGWGVERAYAMKAGVKINDLRLLNSLDLRILKQF